MGKATCWRRVIRHKKQYQGKKQKRELPIPFEESIKPGVALAIGKYVLRDEAETMTTEKSIRRKV